MSATPVSSTTKRGRCVGRVPAVGGDIGCRANRPAEGFDGVRIPGDRVYANLARSRERGVRIPQEVWTRVSTCAADLDVVLPDPLTVRA